MFRRMMSAMNRILSFLYRPLHGRWCGVIARGKKKPALIRGPKRSVENVPESRLNLAWKNSLSMKSCFPVVRLFNKEGMTLVE
jgi:hypothetical protein